MRRVVVLYASVGLLGLLAAVHVTGCSLIGLSAGAVVDATADRRYLVPTGQVARFDPGDSLVLYLKDSTQVRGRFTGTVELPGDVYTQRYALWKRNEAAAVGFPEPGEPVRLKMQGAGLDAVSGGGTLEAFTHDGIRTRRPGHESEHWPYANLQLLLPAGRPAIPGGQLRELRAEGNLPVSTALVIGGADGLRTVALDDIELVAGSTHRNAAKVGFMIGLFADAVVIAILANQRGPFEGTRCDATGPTLFSERVERARVRRLQAMRRDHLLAANASRTP